MVDTRHLMLFYPPSFPLPLVPSDCRTLEKQLKLLSSKALVTISVDPITTNVALRRSNLAEPTLTRTRTSATALQGMAMCEVSTEPIEKVPSAVASVGSEHSRLSCCPVEVVGLDPYHLISHSGSILVGLKYALIPK